MASMRKLRRRLLRWDRYAAKTGMPSAHEVIWLSWDPPLRGHQRAWAAVDMGYGLARRQARTAYWSTELSPCPNPESCGCYTCDDARASEADEEWPDDVVALAVDRRLL